MVIDTRIAAAPKHSNGTAVTMPVLTSSRECVTAWLPKFDSPRTISHTRKPIASGANAKEAAKAAGVFWKQEAEMLRQARAWRLEALDEVMDSINTADVATKTTGMPDQLIAERLLLEIAGRARRLGL